MPEVNMNGGYRLSPQQTLLWDANLSGTETTSYVALAIKSHVNRELCEQAIRQVAEQYEIFKTRFEQVEGLLFPVQVLTELNVNWEVNTDFEQKNYSNEHFKIWLKHSAEQRNLASGVAADWVSFKEHNFLVIYFSYLAVDESSIALFLEKWQIAYQDLVNGKALDQVENLAYIEASDWTNELLATEDSEDGLRFWRQQHFLNTYQQSTSLEKNILAAACYKTSSVYSLPTGLLQSINSYCQDHNVRSNTVFLAVWHLLLHRYQSGDNIVIGCQFDGRTDDELKTTVGPLSRDLPITSRTVDLSHGLKFINGIDRDIKEADVWQDCFHWEMLNEHVEPDKRHFPYRFVTKNTHSELETDPVSAEVFDLQCFSTPYKLTLSIESDEVLANCGFCFKYDRSVIDDTKISLLAEQFVVALTNLIASPDVSPEELEILPNSQQEMILKGFNNSYRDHDLSYPVHQLFELQAQQTPQSIALEHEGEQLTYAQVDARADHIANVLINRGVLSGDHVGVFTHRSFDSAIAILAIFKSGGVYVPLDPSYPESRLAYILSDSNTRFVIAHSSLSNELLQNVDELIWLDKLSAVTEPLKSAKNLVNSRLGAYLIYTSGSTGTPKGTLISHEAFVGHCLGIQQDYQLKSEDRVLLFAPFNFDPSLEQLFPTLISGATVVIREQDVWNITDVAKKIDELALNVVNFPTAYWHLLVQEWENQQDIAILTKELRLVICGGDKMLKEMVKRWQALQLDAISLLNAYGPTEATVTTTTAELSQTVDVSDSGEIPIGRPLANRKLYILDDALRLIPIGCEGELYIGGSSLATEYLNQPELTAERFIPDPFSDAMNARMYKTGDRAYYSVEGDIYFLGRTDAQIKINGFRVELAEIESVLSEFSGITEVAVAVRSLDDQNINKQLIAFFVAHDQTSILKDEVKHYLLHKLPHYMVPAKLIAVPSLPLMPNGKLDRQAIEIMANDVQLDKGHYEAPTTETELVLAGIWQGLFAIDSVSINDNFFSLGGHSLIAMKLVSEVRQKLNVELSLKDIFNTDNLADLATEIEGHEQGELTPLITLKAVDTHEPTPLSYGQERFWFLNELGYGSQYHMLGIVKVKGKLDTLKLQQAVDIIVERHDVLRTGFCRDQYSAQQKVLDTLNVPVEFIKLSDSSGAMTKAQDVMKQWSQRSFDLNEPPLLRVMLVELNEHESILGFCIHHIISDGVSIGIIIREMSQYYTALTLNKTATPAQLDVQYSDYTWWQRKQFNERKITEELAFWRKRLQGYHDLTLPNDFPRSKSLSGQGGSLRIRFEPALVASLNQLSQTHNITLFSLLMTSVYRVLSCYSQQQDFCLGMPVSNRPHDKLMDLVGLFVNTLVIRLKNTQNANVLDFAKEVQNTILDAQQYQSLPFEKLVEAIQPERDMSRNPIFQVLVSHIHPERELVFGGVKTEPLHFPHNSSRFDLSFDFEEESNGDLSLILEYSKDLFVGSTMERMAQHLVQCMKQVVQHSDLPVTDLNIVPCAELQLLSDIGSGKTEPKASADTSLLTLFAAQVAQFPAAMAVTYGEETMSYMQLEQESNKVAEQLIKYGIKSGDLIGVCLSRSLNIIACLLGILKSGAAYVPLDPSYPVGRLKYIIDDSELSMIISQGSLHTLTDQIGNDAVPVVELSTLLHSNAVKVSYSTYYPKVDKEAIAYVMYTSGSTGDPKGVIISHGAVANFLTSMATSPGITPNDRLLSVTTYCFDISVLEFFLPLIVGASCHICSNDSIRNPERLLQEIELIEPTLMQATPATWSMLFQLGWNNQQQMRILCGGEAMPASLKLLFDQHQCQVWNMYGPTETTVWSTFYRLQQDSKIFIGKPINNTRIYLLDDTLQPVPIGVTGELYISGDGLAVEYWKRADLTAERFVNYPLNNDRMYRTGDLARWQYDEQEYVLEYKGRADSQLKLRGFRIESGEIESRLLQQENIQGACVVLHHLSSQLIAYIVVGDARLDLDELSNVLQEYLPDYMLPTSYILLDNLPLTPNGKIDRKTLAIRVVQPTCTAENHQAPTTDMEVMLAELWKDILGCDACDRRDSFFTLGGHSLLVVMLQTRISESLNVHISIEQLFDNHHLDQMAKTIEKSQSDTSCQLEPVVAVTTQELMPLSYAQQGLWLVEQMSGHSSVYNMPSAVRLEGAINFDVMSRCFNEIQRRHQTLRTRFGFVNGKSVQIINEHVYFELDIIDLKSLTDDAKKQTIELLIEQDFDHVFNLEQGPLWRVRVAELSDHEVILLINIHHICADGWSLRIFIDEMKLLYKNLIRNESTELPELAVQYGDYAHWQRKQMQTDRFDESLEFWKNHLENAPELSALPRDHAHPELAVYHGKVLPIELSSTLYKEVKALSERCNSTVYMTLLAAYNLLLSIETGEQDIIVGTDIANRQSKQLEPLIGFFINQIAIRNKLDKTLTVSDFIKQVRRQALEAFKHQQVPFDQLVKHLNITRSVKYAPLFQTKFFMEKIPDETYNTDDFDMSFLDMKRQPARLDLTIGLIESNDTIRGSLVYNIELFNEKSALRMTKRFIQIIELMVLWPETSLSKVKTLLLSIEQDIAEQEQQEFIDNRTKSFNPKTRRKSISA
jgi:amino acid adenylation domain-containing protein